MSEPLRTALAAAVVRILRPLVRAVLRGGMSYKALNDLVKWVYVDVSMKEFTIPGRKNSKSRVAVLTGLTRREVDRLVRLPEPREGAPERYNRAARVLSGWAEDPRFRGADDLPAVLAIENESGFTELVRMYSGNQPYRAVLDELIRVGSVERVDDSHVRLVKAYYEPVSGKLEEEKLNILGIATGDLLETIAYNIRRTDGPVFYQQEIYERIPEEKLDELREIIRKHCDQFAVKTDRMLYAHLGLDGLPKPKSTDRRAGVGVYYFEAEPEDTGLGSAVATEADIKKTTKKSTKTLKVLSN
jgi:Family of unknown function (DUF6502)